MARSEARLSTSIWDDPDFKALGVGPQRAYMFLISQPDLGHTGVIPLRERRWARAAAGLDTAELLADLKALEHARFVVVDEDAEELLVRSLMRRDKVYRQPNVLRAAADQIAQVQSSAVRAALLSELLRIAAGDDVPSGSMPLLAEMVAILGGDPEALPWVGGGIPPLTPNETPIGAPSPTPSERGSGGGSVPPSGTPSAASPGERGVVTAVSSASPFPNPRSPTPVPPETAPPSPTRAAKPHAERRGSRLPDDFKVTPEMAAWAREHVPELAGRGETEKFIDYWQAQPGAKGRKVDWPATWRNWMRTAAERLPSSRSPTAAPNAFREPDRPSPFAGLSVARSSNVTQPAPSDQEPSR